MKILRAADYKRMPWKNGGGETTEIAVYPPSASVEDFDWRISMATVSKDGPFSIFDGIDRTISVLCGGGITLSVEGAEDVHITTSSAPHAFPGDKATSAKLVAGAITDLNMMAKRNRFRLQVQRVTLSDLQELGSFHVPMFVISLTTNEVGLDETSLGYLDSVLLEAGETAPFFADGPMKLLLAKIIPIVSVSTRAAVS
ncbi:HutD family protein [Agrobacterium tumefaciens]|uniref:Riorf43 protein n=2 Tax=Rhizobium/Agrobacterium group TaxID=227290 RepID=Q9KWE1_RHIRH|nr:MULTISPECIES: HutD family protein [Rhizobium/Agrobacterium group]ASK42922.1 hypothetical protein [Rhizobium rhizogenes]MCZ7976433.1 HutD family protein [Agrobacterium salinitolerans]MDA5243321.1 HutD family protein [Agrobacterium sp. MAFF310724]MDA5247497.1 HutD family protein [Agrobacterium sp. MAFF210268]TRB03185.1 HutD family protein [Agrobacterium tumefaciens]